MSNIIDVLENLGRDANLRYAESDQLMQALAEAGVDPFTRRAILASDARHLEFLAGAAPNVCCMIAPLHDDDDLRDEPRKAGDSDHDRPAKQSGAANSNAQLAA